MTIRRDLEHLAGQGVLRRVRGGAVSLLLRGEEPPFALRELAAREAKQRIAAEVGRLVADGETVLLDSGTTAVEVARVLHDRRVTVMPLSLQAAMVLSTSRAATIVLPGGQLRPGELAATGHLAEATVRALRFDTAVLGCCGLSAEHGVTAHNLADIAVKQAAIASARRVVAAADTSKFTRTAFGVVCPLERLDVIVTDDAVPDDVVAAITAIGVTVRRA